MPHNRLLVLGGASLTMARANRHDLPVMGEIMDEFERVMIDTGFLENAPFKWVGLILRYGLKNEEEPHYQRIDKKDLEIPVAIELDVHDLVDASREELKKIFLIATLKVLVDVGQKYKLPYQKFAEMLQQLSESRDSESS
mgnify:FL=1